MVRLNKYGKLLMLATLISLTGCSSDEENSAPSEEKISLKFGNEGDINSLNLVDYAFKGSCSKNGEGNISFSIKNSGSDEGKVPSGGHNRL